MKRLLRGMGTGLALACAAGTAGAQTIDFELGASSAYDYPVIGSYAGYNFLGFWGLNATAFSAMYPSGYQAQSGTGVAFGRGAASVSSTNAFFLSSLYLGSGWYSDYPVTIVGSRNGADLWSYTVNGQTSGPQQFALTGADAGKAIDNLRFETNGYEFYVDDMTLTSQPGFGATVTPEPVTLALLGTGLAGIGGFGAARRRRREGTSTE